MMKPLKTITLQGWGRKRKKTRDQERTKQGPASRLNLKWQPITVHPQHSLWWHNSAVTRSTTHCILLCRQNLMHARWKATFAKLQSVPQSVTADKHMYLCWQPSGTTEENLLLCANIIFCAIVTATLLSTYFTIAHKHPFSFDPCLADTYTSAHVQDESGMNLQIAGHGLL